MDGHRSGAPIAVGLVLAASLGGCSLDRPLPTHDNAIDRGTGFEGFLRFDGTCVWVVNANVEVDTEALNVVWPSGYRSRGRPLEMIDGSGAVIAREGDLVSFGIGDMNDAAIPGCPRRRTALATEISQVNGHDLHSPPPVIDRPISR